LPRVNGRETVAALVKAGFVVTRRSGGHIFLANLQTRRRTVVPDHGSHEVPVGTLHAVLTQAELTVEQFIELLK
jgi:predicted RNA binding protein YcfA (HicA-like mRNA interferase family)